MRTSSRLETVYSATLRLADRVWLHRQRVVLVGAPVLVVILVSLGTFILNDFPNSGDEYVYLYQAETFSRARLWNPTPAHPEAFQFNYIVQDGPRTYGSFPIGWPLTLAAAMAIGFPAWLLNPLLATVTLLLAAALASRLYGPHAAVLTAFLIGTTPFFLFNGASYFSHTFCGVLLLGAAYLVVRSGPASIGSPIAVGFLLAWAVLVRYYTGAIASVLIVVPMLFRRNEPTVGPGPRASAFRFLLICLGALPPMLVLLFYNEAMMGHPWQPTTQAATISLWFQPGFAVNGLEILGGHLLRLVTWTPPALLVLYVYYLCTAPRMEHGATVRWMLVAMAAPLYFFIQRGGNQYGPRFYYEAFLFAAVFLAGQLTRNTAVLARPRLERAVLVAFALSVLVLPIAFGIHAFVEHTVITERTEPYRLIAARGGPSLVFLSGRVGTLRSMGAQDLTRNGATYDGTTLYALDDGVARNCAVAAAYPGRSLYTYRWDRERARGELTPFQCTPRS